MGLNPVGDAANFVGQSIGRALFGLNEDAALDQLTTGAPGRAPDLADAAVQQAAAEGRMRLGMGRAATFLTGLGRSALTGSAGVAGGSSGGLTGDRGGGTGGSSGAGTLDAGMALTTSPKVSSLNARRIRVGARSNQGGIFDGP